MVAVATAGEARTSARFFYVWMAGLCVLIAIGGFAGTYWLQWPVGTFVGSRLLHMHAVVFTAWPLLFLSQTWLQANGRLDHHRAWGLAGIALATAMVLLGGATAISGAAHDLAEGRPATKVLGFLVTPLSAITMFAGFFAAAVAFRGRTEVHRRLMLLATAAVLPAAMARVFFLLNTGGGPGLRPGLGLPLPVERTIAPGLVVYLIIVAAMIYDWRTRGRPHPAYLIGLTLLVAMLFLRIPLSTNPQWLAFADGLVTMSRY
ncbi:MAG TPA: hypothetical protein VGF26_00080 [Ramlibacter sp.]